jgi:hypothetical protein
MGLVVGSAKDGVANPMNRDTPALRIAAAIAVVPSAPESRCRTVSAAVPGR